MIEFKRILFPVDMSEQVDWVAPFVKAMAKRFDSEVVMLYVAEFVVPIYVPPEAMFAASFADNEQVHRERLAKLDTMCSMEFDGINVERKVVEGDAALQIVEYARANDVGLIMMPTHGYGSFRRFLLGSVAAKVLHDTERPVWTGVHSSEPWAVIPNRFDRVLCAIDTDSNDIRVVGWAADFAKRLNISAELIHAIPAAAVTEEESDKAFRESLFKVAHEGIDKMQKEAGTSLPVTVRGGQPDRVAHDAAQDLNADLIIIGRGKLEQPLGRLRSHAYSIIREAPCPVISI